MRLSLVVLLAAASSVAAQTKPCTVCPDGSAITLPSAVIPIPDVGNVPCADLSALIGELLPDETDDNCVLLRAVSSICGCPIMEDACYMCGGVNRVPSDLQEAPLVFLDTVEGISTTCKLMEASLLSMDISQDGFCGLGTTWLDGYCCDTNYKRPEDGAGCDMCAGQALDNPDQMVTFFNSGNWTCGQLQSGAQFLLNASSEECATLLRDVAPQCGCEGLGGTPKPATSAPSPLVTESTVDSDGNTDMPSDMPSDVPSDMPSDMPSLMPSGVPDVTEVTPVPVSTIDITEPTDPPTSTPTYRPERTFPPANPGSLVSGAVSSLSDRSFLMVAFSTLLLITAW